MLQAPGSHWVAFFVDHSNRAEYFDAYGEEPKLRSFRSFLEKAASWRHNQVKIQGGVSTACGQFCLFYLLHRARGVSMARITAVFSLTDFEWNDEEATEVLNNHFGVKLDSFDQDFVVEQICHSLYSSQ